MVSRITLFAAALLLSAASVLAQLDLNVTPRTRELEGALFPELTFHDGKDLVTYDAPAGWTYQGSATTLTLTPPQKSQALAAMQAFPRSPLPASLTAERIAGLKQRAIRLGANGAGNVEIVSEAQSPIQIDGKETFEVVLAYVLYGQRFQSSVLFLTLDNAEMVFRLQCRASDFAELSKAFRGSLCGLQWQRAHADARP